MAGVHNEQAVSVIVGTLLLILITVIAAAGLALMVSQMQKDEMNRQSHLAAVKSEKIEIMNVGLTNDRAAWNQSPLNIPTDQDWDNWSSISFTLVNLNIEEVRVIGIAINDRYSANITTIEDNPPAPSHLYNISGREYLSLQGTRSQKVQVNFTDDFPATQYVPSGSQIRVRIMTTLYNTFEKTLSPPNPVFQTKIETEDLGAVQRRVIVLDGSASTADTMVADWNWTIYSGAKMAPLPNWSDTSKLTISYSQGKIARVQPTDNGPFRIRLKVTDDVGMSRISNPVDIPSDQNYVPPANFQAYFIPSLTYINTTINDINGGAVNNSVVNFIFDSNSNPSYNNLSLSNYIGMTDNNGMNSSWVMCRSGTIGGSGTVKVKYGNFEPIPVMVSNSTC